MQNNKKVLLLETGLQMLEQIIKIVTSASFVITVSFFIRFDVNTIFHLLQITGRGFLLLGYKNKLYNVELLSEFGYLSAIAVTWFFKHFEWTSVSIDLHFNSPTSIRRQMHSYCVKSFKGWKYWIGLEGSRIQTWWYLPDFGKIQL